MTDHRCRRHLVVVPVIVAALWHASAASAIVGGSPAEPADFAGAVRWEGGCSGVLVKPRLVLTADHCIDAPQDKSSVDAVGTTVQVGNPNARAPQRRVVVRADPAPQVFSPPSYSPDLAMLVLNQPADVVPGRVDLTAATSDALASATPIGLVISGFGSTEPEIASPTLSPLLHVAAVRTASCDEVAPDLPPEQRSYLACVVADDARSDGVRAGAPCYGDSGAPAAPVAAPQPTVVGIMSGADGTCDGNGNSLITRLSAAGGWIAYEMRRRLPAAEPWSSRCRRARRAGARARRRAKRAADGSRTRRARLERQAQALADQVFASC